MEYPLILNGKKFGTKIVATKTKTAFNFEVKSKGCFLVYLLNISFKAFAGKNLTFWEAAICICSPVLGFRPTLAFLLATL